MKNILFFVILLFAVFSCKTQVDTLKTPIVEPAKIYPSVPSFQGNIFDAPVYYEEGIGLWKASSETGFKPAYSGIEFTPYDLSIALAFQKITIMNNVAKGIQMRMALPFVASTKEYNDIEFIKKNVLVKGKKMFLYDSNIKYPAEKHEQFAFYYTNTEQEGKIINCSTAWGSQEGSSLEMVDVKDITQKETHSGLTIFLITFEMNCKMYAKDGNYIGDIKGTFAGKFQYALIKL